MADKQEPVIELADVHAHILPGMDDGPKTLEDSLAMLRFAYWQGVRSMWSTSHFYPMNEDPASFLRRRAEAAERIREKWDAGSMPHIALGAEVAYFYGIGRCQAAADLTVGGSPFILIEMPTDEWSPDVVEDLLMVKYVLGLKPIIAHVERCMLSQRRRVVRRLSDEGVYFQTNAAFLADTENYKREIRAMVREKMIDLVASDCHGTERRKPNLPDGINALTAVDPALTRNVQLRAMRMTAAARPFV